MPVATKRKRSRKTTFKTNPYPVQEAKTIQQSTSNPFTFGPDLKTSSFSNRQNITNGGNPVFQFHIPNVDPHKATLLNDEVDMYFPRKHFLSKYQMLNDLLENIIIKPIPTDKIIPPRLFPIAFVDGMPYEKKRAELLKGVSEIAKHKSQDDLVDLKNDEKSQDANLTLDQTKNEIKTEIEDNKEAAPKLNSGVVTDFNTTQERKKEENKNEVSKDGKNNSKNDSGKYDVNLKNEDGTRAFVKDIEDDLSDYDPDFDGYQIPYPKDSTETKKVINDYLKSRMKIKVRTDFLFGDLETMKMQEYSLAEIEKETQQKGQEPFEFGERFNYNMKAIDDLHQTFLSYTANSIEECENKVSEIESDLKSKFKKRFVDSNEKNQFKTQAFDSFKTGLTVEDYNSQFKKVSLQANDIPQNLSSALSLQTNASSIVGGENSDVKIDRNPGASPTSQILIEPPASISFSPRDLVATNEEATLVSTSQNQEQNISPSLPLAHGDTAVADQISGQGSMDLVPQDPSEINDHVSDVEKGSQDLVTDLTKKTSSNDMNNFLKSQNNFDFENEMLYDSADFNNDDNDDDFGSLSNEVFLNM